jgi:hypothetical protein
VLAPSGIEISMVQSGQRTVPIRSDLEKTLEPPAVETNHDLLPHHDDRDCHAAGPRHQLLARCLVVGDVLALECDPFLRKKLFREVPSGGV